MRHTSPPSVYDSILQSTTPSERLHGALCCLASRHAAAWTLNLCIASLAVVVGPLDARIRGIHVGIRQLCLDRRLSMPMLSLPLPHPLPYIPILAIHRPAAPPPRRLAACS